MNRACDSSPHTALIARARSLAPVVGLAARHGYGSQPQAAISLFPCRSLPFQFSCTQPPASRQPPFGVGLSSSGPLCPVMLSRCLSAGSLRLLPASCAHWGLGPSLRSAYSGCASDPVGVATFHTHEMPLGVGASCTAGNGCPRSQFVGPASRAPNITVSAGYGDQMSRGLIRGSLAFTRPVFP